MKIVNIDWDTDEVECKGLELPTEVEIPDEVADELFDGGYDDEIADYLSDEYGYALFGFDILIPR
jgi:hypothetical protein